MKKMIKAVGELHGKIGHTTHSSNEIMLYRMNLLIEEVGEISECLTKNEGDIAQEHADLLIVLIGNCIVLNIDIEDEFWKKMNLLMAKSKIKAINGHKRLTTHQD